MKRSGNVPGTPRAIAGARNYQIQKQKQNRAEAPLPPDGGEAAAPPPPENPPPDEFPEFPEEATSMFMIMPGDHQLEEIEAREVWGHLWRTWGDKRLCYTFYEHQQWCTKGAWVHAIKTAVERGVHPTSIKYLEIIGMDMDANGAKKRAPARKADLGPVAYVPRVVQAPLPPSVGVPKTPDYAPGEVARLLGLKGGDQ